MIPSDTIPPETRDQGRPPVENIGQPARWDDLHIAPDGDALPLLADLDGQVVDAIITKCKVNTFKGEQVLELRLELLRDGARWVELPCYFRLPARLRDNRTVIPRRSKYYIHWTRMNHNQRPSRRDRMSPAIFRDKLVRARIHTVKEGAGKDRGSPGRAPRQLPPEEWYSVVAEFAL
jgi:hypothetical protein